MSEIINSFTQRLSDSVLLTMLLNLLIVAVVTFVAYLITGQALKGLEKAAELRTRTKADEEILSYLRKPVLRLIVLLGAYVFFDMVAEVWGGGYVKFIKGIFYVIIALLIMNALFHLTELLMRIYSARLLKRGIISGKEEFFPLVVKVSKVVIFFIGIIIILKHFGQDVQSLVVSLGVGSLAIALAAQETLSNMIAGFVIMTDRPFRVGDRIQLASGERGDVYNIGLRSTKVLTFDNTLIIVPNAAIVKEKVLNLSYPDPITRVRLEVGVAYGADLDRVKALLVDVCRQHPKVLAEPVPQAYFTNFGDSSLDFMVVCRVPSWRDEWEVTEALRLEIYRRFNREGIEIPFPQRTLWWGKDSNGEDNAKAEPPLPE